MSMPTFAKRCRQVLAIMSIIISTAAVALPDPMWSKFFMAIGTGCNAASLYMLKEEQDSGANQPSSLPEEPSTA